jgi:hypothetical protein
MGLTHVWCNENNFSLKFGMGCDPCKEKMKFLKDKNKIFQKFLMDFGPFVQRI